MPHAEYLEWQEFYQLEPFGLMVQDASQAHIASLIANVNRDAKKRPQPFHLSDFMLFREQEKKESLPDNPDARTEAMITAMFGGKVVRIDK